MDSIQYSSYNFPEPLPLLAESSKSIYISGLYDHSTLDIKLVGFLTGSNLSGLHLQKQQMISGLLNEYEDLSIQISGDNKTYSKVLPISIDFSDSDLTTILPYNVSFLAFTGESFSQFFGISNPKNEWSFEEQENQIVKATHTISAQGEKINDQEPLQNAIDFVTSNTGFQNVAPILKGNNAFLKSRSESINRKTANYSITEVYHFDGSDRQETTDAIVTYDTTINFNKDGGINAGINGSIYGAFDGSLVNTGLFTPQNATDALINDLGASKSSYESEAFSFVRSGPSTYSYNINTGVNSIDFEFTYVDIDNIDQDENNVAHKYKTSIQASKDNANLTVSAEGELYFNSIDSAVNTGLYETSQRFQYIDDRFGVIDTYNIAYQGLQDFIEDNNEYSCPNLTLNRKVKSKTVNKDPVGNRIEYNYTYDTSINLSSSLENVKISVTDKVPLVLSNVVPTLDGFADQVISDRTLGEYTVSATADEDSSKILQLKNLVDSYTKGHTKQSDSHSISDNNISYTITEFY